MRPSSTPRSTGSAPSELGLTETQVADDINIAMSGSFQVKPLLWTDPKTGIPWEL